MFFLASYARRLSATSSWTDVRAALASRPSFMTAVTTLSWSTRGSSSSALDARAAARDELVQETREALHPARERDGVVGLDDEVQVIVLDGELEHAESFRRGAADLARKTTIVRCARKCGASSTARSVTWTGTCRSKRGRGT
jgi:hypothetical protein